MADISKFMSKDVGDLGKLLGIDKSNLTSFLGFDMPSGYPPVAPWTDTFTGANGSDPDSTYWNLNQYLKIQSNQLHGSIPATNQGSISSKFKLSGNFDVFVSFNDLVLGGINSGNNLRFVVMNNDYSDVVMFDVRNQYTGQVFLTNIKYNGSYYGEVHTSRSNTYGGLRIIRVGTTATSKYKDGNGDWTTLTSRVVGSDDMRIRLGIYSASGTVSGDFDDFTVQSGAIS